eukprot:GHVQ01035578.1.p1 GENE.GHVQ01035578.1~~GHVQ01035578.1.p1  ORF type:complete len:142 (-),score=24.56 GHVQ01035578.1:397-822(-)
MQNELSSPNKVIWHALKCTPHRCVCTHTTLTHRRHRKHTHSHRHTHTPNPRTHTHAHLHTQGDRYNPSLHPNAVGCTHETPSVPPTSHSHETVLVLPPPSLLHSTVAVQVVLLCVVIRGYTANIYGDCHRIVVGIAHVTAV